MDVVLNHYEENIPLDTPLLIRVDEVTMGAQYYKTKFILKIFMMKRFDCVAVKESSIVCSITEMIYIGLGMTLQKMSRR